MKITKSYLTDLTYQINGAAIEVHKRIGPGLLESVYHRCMIRELSLRGVNFATEMQVPVIYKEETIDTALRCDLFIEDILVVELKAVKEILPIHEAQLITYMNLLEAPKGVLYNFNVVNLYQEGQKTFVNRFFKDLPM